MSQLQTALADALAANATLMRERDEQTTKFKRCQIECACLHNEARRLTAMLDEQRAEVDWLRALVNTGEMSLRPQDLKRRKPHIFIDPKKSKEKDGWN